MSFDEVQFPTSISFGSAGGPERKTDIVTLRSGFEQRNAIWADSRRRYDAALGMRSLGDLHEVIAFFEGRMGRLRGFRWKDWSDYRSGSPVATPTALDQLIGVGDASTTTFQLIKVYTSGLRTWTRDIKKPVSGSVLIALDGTPTASGWSVDTTTGIVTFLVAPGAGVDVTAGFEFDVPARFDNDSLSISVDLLDVGALPAIEVVEIRV